MNFKEATDVLFEGLSHEDLAGILGNSIASIRQARLDPEAKAHRTPPPGWERAVIELATKQMRAYRALISALESKQQRSLFDAAPGSRHPS
jgi:hypothetical protein